MSFRTPSDVRSRTVARELARVTRPGGLIVVADSAQLIESSSLAVFFRNFQRQFHEPFYENYLSDPLEHLLEATPGVTVEHSSTAFVSKVVVARTASDRA